MNYFDLRTAVIMAAIVVSSGCVSLNVNHEIHKDGSSDIGIEVQSDSQIVRSSLKEQFESSFAVENAVLDEGDSSFSYKFENVYPQQQEERFSESLRSNQEGESENSGFSYEKDSGLIYTHFTLRMNSTGFDSSDSNFSSEYSQFGESLSSGLEMNYNVEPFGEVVGTNGQEMEDGRVRFDLTEDKEYYVEFKALSADVWLSNLGSSQPERPDWGTSEWSECTKNGTQSRTVELENDAENYMFKPPTQRSCEYQTQLSAEELTLTSTDLNGYSVGDEGEVTAGNMEEAYERTFSKSNATLQHTVVKPAASTDSYINSQISDLEAQDYETATEFITEAETTEAYSKTVDTETVIEGSRYYTYEQEIETVRKVVLASKYDVVHKFVLEGQSQYGFGIDGIDNFNSIASEAVTATE